MDGSSVVGVDQGAFPNAPQVNLPALPAADAQDNAPLKITIHPPQQDTSKSDDWFGANVVPSDTVNSAPQQATPEPAKGDAQDNNDWFTSAVVPSDAVKGPETTNNPSSSQAAPPTVGEDVKSTLLGHTLPMAAANLFGGFSYPLRMVQDAGNYFDKHVANLSFDQSDPDTRTPWVSTPAEMLNDTANAIGHPLYQPQTTTGKYVDTLSQFLLGGGWMGAAQKASSLSQLASNVGKTVAPSLLGGAASETAGQFTDGTPYEQPARIAAAILGGGIPSAAAKAVRPMSAAGRSSMAVNDIVKNVGNPSEVNQQIQARANRPEPEGPVSSIAPQQQQSLAELSPNDQKLASYQGQVLDAAQKIGGDDFAAQLNKLQTARQDANDSFTKAMNTGDPSAVGDMFTSHIDQLNNESNALDSAQKNLSQNLTPNSDMSDLGTQATSQFETARAAAKDAENKAWAELEPYKQVPTNPELIGTAVDDNINQIDPMAGDELHPREQTLYNTVKAWGNGPQPFGRITAFSRNLNDGISEVGRQQGFKSAPVQRLMNLKNSVKNTVSGKVGEIHTVESQLVDQGRMSPEETLFNNIAEERNGWLSSRKSATAGGNASANSARIGAGRSQAIRNPSGAEVQKDGISGRTTRDKGVSESDELALDKAPHEVFSAANKATQERAGTFDNPDVLSSAFGKTNNEYNLSEGQRAQKFFQPGEGGGKIIQDAKKAGISEDILNDIGLNKLRRDGVLDADGSVNAQKLNKWMTRHQSTLDALPDLKKTIADTEKAQDALANQAASIRNLRDTFDRSAAAKFIGNEKPESVIGKILKGNTPESSIDDIVKRIGNNSAARDGLKSATLDHLNSKFSGSDASLSKSNAYKKYLDDNRASLVKLMGVPSYSMLQRMVDQDIDALKVGPKSKVKVSKTEEKTNIFHDLKEAAGPEGEAATIGALAEGALHVMSHHPIGSAVAGTSWIYKAMRKAGMTKLAQLKADMVLHPEKYASVFNKYDKSRGAPTLLRRNLTSAILSSAPTAEAVYEQRKAARQAEAAR